MQFKQSYIKRLFICIQKSENINKYVRLTFKYFIKLVSLYFTNIFRCINTWTVFQSLFILFKYYLSQGLILLLP